MWAEGREIAGTLLGAGWAQGAVLLPRRSCVQKATFQRSCDLSLGEQPAWGALWLRGGWGCRGISILTSFSLPVSTSSWGLPIGQTWLEAKGHGSLLSLKWSVSLGTKQGGGKWSMLLDGWMGRGLSTWSTIQQQTVGVIVGLMTHAQ